MPVPKRKLSRARGRKRRTNQKCGVPQVNACSHCGSPKLPHRVCSTCGYYAGKVVIEK